MKHGWVRVNIPLVLQNLADWRVRIANIEGLPEVTIKAPLGNYPVIVEADKSLLNIRIKARIQIPIVMEQEQLIDIHIPSPYYFHL
ncbi:hypothetical protein O0550_21670 [Brevibacillus halotolerans]|uniref:hypothetical protein n=1 Tax=Brevibacillus TaxID=55080 RepID=UPI00215B78BF|nr:MULTISPECIES: hypothetical protein [Brevibacillus]MCR8965781.1 hypothetical protein [Brevibacillus laterosporus]MCZ0837936.1 hypothetical protein [Brevibacillus halotolerans]